MNRETLKNAIIAEIQNIMSEYAFEKNDKNTHSRLRMSLCDYVCYLQKARRVLWAHYKCDEDNNPTENRVNRELVVRFDYNVINTYRIVMKMGINGFNVTHNELGKEHVLPDDKKDPFVSGEGIFSWLVDASWNKSGGVNLSKLAADTISTQVEAEKKKDTAAKDKERDRIFDMFDKQEKINYETKQEYTNIPFKSYKVNDIDNLVQKIQNAEPLKSFVDTPQQDLKDVDKLENFINEVSPKLPDIAS